MYKNIFIACGFVCASALFAPETPVDSVQSTPRSNASHESVECHGTPPAQRSQPLQHAPRMTTVSRVRQCAAGDSSPTSPTSSATAAVAAMAYLFPGEAAALFSQAQRIDEDFSGATLVISCGPAWRGPVQDPVIVRNVDPILAAAAACAAAPARADAESPSQASMSEDSSFAGDDMGNPGVLGSTATTSPEHQPLITHDDILEHELYCWKAQERALRLAEREFFDKNK